jgi:CRP-like cAMP-binding protein
MARHGEAELIHADAGPVIRGIEFEKNADGSSKGWLSEPQRRVLAALATLVTFPPRAIVYRENGELSWIFISKSGVLKAFREMPSGKRRVASFLFPGDIFGLAENGRYLNTVQTVTNTTLYQIPSDALAGMLRRDPELQFQFLCKITHALRQGQHHAIVIARKDAAGRLAMFLSVLEQNEHTHSQGGWIQLPMSRTDLAEYLGLSLESVSRATSALARRGIVTFQGGHAARVIDRARFEKLVNAL